MKFNLDIRYKSRISDLYRIRSDHSQPRPEWPAQGRMSDQLPTHSSHILVLTFCQQEALTDIIISCSDQPLISSYPVWNKKSIVRFIINFKNSNECWHLLWAVVIDCSGLGWIIQSMNDGSVRSSVSMLLINSPSLHVNLTPGMTAEGSPVS